MEILEKNFISSDSVTEFADVLRGIKNKYELKDLDFTETSNNCKDPNCITVVSDEQGKIFIDLTHEKENERIELHFLGRGSAFNAKEGNTAAYIDEGDDLILIDCGSTVFSKLMEKDLLRNRKRVHVLITHLHSDHIGSLSTLIEYCYYALGIPLYIISSYHLIDDIEKLLYKLAVNDDMYFIVPINESSMFGETKVDLSKHYINSIGISVYLQNHVDNLRSVGYLLSRGKNLVFYSGDCCSINHIVIDTLRKNGIVYHDACIADYEGNVHTPISLLVHEIDHIWTSNLYCMHFDNNDAIEEALKCRFKIVEVE